jgi:peptidoglycan/LPS O-acetylase OafA/YrhL
MPVVQIEKARLSKLEALRGAAAVYVLAYHLVRARLGIEKGLLSFVFSFGQEAVILFFLLSGFVIYFSFSTGQDKSFAGYFRRRWLRIYPILFVALFISWYFCQNQILKTDWLTLLGNLCMLQDFSGAKPGVLVNAYCGNVPLWSLSYEWWFYMLFFPIYNYIKPPKQQWVAISIAFVGLVSGLVWPNQLSRFAAYFVIWWAGAEMARTYLSSTPLTFYSQRVSMFALLVFIACLSLSVAFWIQHGLKIVYGLHPVLELRHFVAALLLMAAGISWARARWIFFEPTMGWFKVVAPYSYALYILHHPVAISSHWLPVSLPAGLQVVLPIVAALLLAYFIEAYYQPGFKKVFVYFFLASRREK